MQSKMFSYCYYYFKIVFGTPAAYFKEITKRSQQFPTLKGDFFVYSDIFSEGRPAYWSGYYTTRPFMKLLSRQLENNMRGAEIVYTVALNKAKQNKLMTYSKILERDYEKLIKARRNLGKIEFLFVICFNNLINIVKCEILIHTF